MDDKNKKFYTGLLLLVLGLAIGLLTSKYVFNNLGCYKSSFDRDLVEAANEINQHLPMMIDSETRIDSTIALPGKTFQYFYTLVNYSKDQLDAGDFEKRLRPLILNSIKTNTDMENFRKNKVTLVYLYRDKDGNEFLKLTFSHDDYTDSKEATVH
jgi:hypothetical protein